MTRHQLEPASRVRLPKIEVMRETDYRTKCDYRCFLLLDGKVRA